MMINLSPFEVAAIKQLGLEKMHENPVKYLFKLFSLSYEQTSILA